MGGGSKSVETVAASTVSPRRGNQESLRCRNNSASLLCYEKTDATVDVGYYATSVRGRRGTGELSIAKSRAFAMQADLYILAYPY